MNAADLFHLARLVAESKCAGWEKLEDRLRREGDREAARSAGGGVPGMEALDRVGLACVHGADPTRCGLCNIPAPAPAATTAASIGRIYKGQHADDEIGICGECGFHVRGGDRFGCAKGDACPLAEFSVPETPAVPESGLRECAHCGSVGPHKPREVCCGDWSVECSCGMETKLYPTPQQAAEVWNTRAPSSAQAAIRVGEAEITAAVETVVGSECFGGGIFHDHVTTDAIRAFKKRLVDAFTRLQSTGGAGK